MKAVKSTLTFLNIQWLRSFSFLIRPGFIHTHAMSLHYFFSERKGTHGGGGEGGTPI